MGFATKKPTRWELQKLVWTFISIPMFVPVPVHVFAFVMLAQARKAKVRSWYLSGMALLLVELALLVPFVHFFGSFSTGLLLTLGGYVASYIVGNGLLLNRARPYLRRLELAEIRPLVWIPTASPRNLLLQPQDPLDTPQLFVERLLHWRKEIANPAIQRNIDRIIHLFQLLEQKDAMEAEKFLVRHATVVNALRQYGEIERSKLHNSVTVESKRKMEDVIAKATTAIEQEVTNQLKSGILDVSAETDVYIQTLKNRNLL